MEFADRILKRVDCGEEFVFSAGEQLFFWDKGFSNLPRHCKKCRAKHVHKTGRVETRVTCSECGAVTTVPFVPHTGRPVLCRSCFQRRLSETPPRSADDNHEG
jgi:CxxC-x17-CxxC domain-containing protein